MEKQIDNTSNQSAIRVLMVIAPLLCNNQFIQSFSVFQQQQKY